MKDKRKEYTNEMVKKLMNTLKSLEKDVNNSDTSIKIKSSQMDVIINTIHFLLHYDENVKVLHDYWISKNKENTNEER